MIDKINWQKCKDLIPTIIQDSKTLEVLMLGFMNKEALTLSEESKKVHFWSRTKNRIWMKGEESGNILNIIDIQLDCDNDSLLILVSPIGNTCHIGTKSCFGTRTNFISDLEDLISQKMQNPDEKSYVSKLSALGINKISQKIGEEATEVIISAINETEEDFIGECADLFFHLLVLLSHKNLSINDIIDKMKDRDKR